MGTILPPNTNLGLAEQSTPYPKTPPPPKTPKMPHFPPPGPPPRDPPRGAPRPHMALRRPLIYPSSGWYGYPVDCNSGISGGKMAFFGPKRAKRAQIREIPPGGPWGVFRGKKGGFGGEMPYEGDFGENRGKWGFRRKRGNRRLRQLRAFLNPPPRQLQQTNSQSKN